MNCKKCNKDLDFTNKRIIRGPLCDKCSETNKQLSTYLFLPDDLAADKDFISKLIRAQKYTLREEIEIAHGKYFDIKPFEGEPVVKKKSAGYAFGENSVGFKEWYELTWKDKIEC